MPSSTSDAEPAKKSRFGRKKKVKNPKKKPGWFAQIRQVFSMTRKADPAAVWWMLLVALGILLVTLLIGLWWGRPIYTTLIGLPLALLGAVIVLGRKAERAAFAQIDGTPGATSAALGQLKRGWFYDKEPVAAESGGTMRGMRDLHNAAMVFRAVGKPGVILLAEGPKGPAQRLLGAERKRVTRVVGEEVPVHPIMVGNAEGQVPLRRLRRTMTKLPGKLSKVEAGAVQQRLKALGTKSKPPVPGGMDPTKAARMSRKALRGR